MKKLFLGVSLLLVISAVHAVSTETSYCGRLEAVAASTGSLQVSGREFFLPETTTRAEVQQLQALIGRNLCLELEDKNGRMQVSGIAEGSSR